MRLDDQFKRREKSRKLPAFCVDHFLFTRYYIDGWKSRLREKMINSV